jgi:ubiquinol-cytochrome c reductase iron-sulfur subunit
MNENKNKDKSTRRDFLTTVTATAGAVGVGAAVFPIISQMNPDSSVKALASIEVDISKVKEGQEITVLWRGKPVFIKRRTKEDILKAKETKMADLKDPQEDKARVIKEEWLVVIGVCTHLGCVPAGGQGDYSGWFCPCHGSHYDTSGRIRKGPAPTNLEVPKYEFVGSDKIKIG